MAYCGYVVKVENLRKHNNADRLQVATFFGNDTIVGLDVKVGDIGIYFPTDGCLDQDYCDRNHLCRKKVDGSPDTGYLERGKNNIKALKLRGEKSDGLYMPLSSLDYLFNNGAARWLNVGDKIDTVDGHEICKKYIPKIKNRQGMPTNGNRARKKIAPIAPLFVEHADTEQLAYNLGAFKPGDLVEITLKMHGTSQRTAYLPKFKGYKRTLWDKLRKRDGTPLYDWGYVTGARRCVINDFDDGGYYGNNEFREPHAKFFEGKLLKGEEVYYEVVGFQTTGAPIMASASNKKVDKLVGNKEFSKTYGEMTVFSYGCAPDGLRADKMIKDVCDMDRDPTAPQSDFYVYRMTMTNEDGDMVEYPPDYMRYRCEQMGIKCVPLLWRGIIPEAGENGLVQSEDFFTDENGNFSDWVYKTPGDYIKDIAEQYYDGPDPVGKSHVREGVVCRIVNKPKFCAYKHKNFSFKVLEGLIKESADAPDMEEAQESICP